MLPLRPCTRVEGVKIDKKKSSSVLLMLLRCSLSFFFFVCVCVGFCWKWKYSLFSLLFFSFYISLYCSIV
jgi:hypothetical protein